MPAMIVLGDKTDHGGEVIEASGVTDTHGKNIARVGDRVTCPKKGHGGTTVIVSGDMTMVIDGKAVAFHGCKTACGATLISSQMLTTVAAGGEAGVRGDEAIRASLRTASDPLLADLPVGFDEQAQLPAHAEGLPYRIETSDGRVMKGAVGVDGKLPRVGTLSADEYSVYWGDEALARSGVPS